MTDIEKQCVLCGQSCAGQPRIKNDQGQYAHQACVKARESAPDSANSVGSEDLSGDEAMMSDLLGDGLGDGLGDDFLLGDLPDEPEQHTGGLRQACPGCGSSLADSAVVCMSCGFDTRSGKARKTKVAKVKESKSGLSGAASSAGSAAASGLGYLAGSVLGAAIAGSLGALLWAGLIIGIEREMGWVAIIVGVLSGFGAVMGARGESGLMTGLVACVVCLGAICAGKYYGVKHLADTFLAELQTEESTYFDDLNNVEREQHAMALYVDDILQERIDSGTLTGETADDYENLILSGYFPDDYPKDVINESRKRWRTQSEESQATFFDKLQAEMNAELDAMVETERENIYEQGFIATFGYRDIIFFGFALAAAFGVGSGGGQD